MEDVQSSIGKAQYSERQSDADFLCELQRVTSPDDVIGDVNNSSSWLKLVRGQIVSKAPTLTLPTSSVTSARRRRRQMPYDENGSSVSDCRPARRSLFATSTPLRDITNSNTSTYRRCVSDTDTATATTTDKPTPALAKCQSMSTAVLSAATVDDDDYNERLVGDFTRLLCLPVMGADAKHCDLNNISHHTV